MDSGKYQYSQYETTAEYDSRMNSYSSGQQQSQNMMSEQSGAFSQQSGMLPQQPGMMSQQSGMYQQWGTVSQQSGMMSQQSGTMSQQSGMMSQQSGVWNSVPLNSSGTQQSSNAWMPHQSDAMMTRSDMNFAQEGVSNFNKQPDNYSMSQQSNSFRSPQAPDMYTASAQNRSDPQQFTNMPQQQRPDYKCGGSMQQQGRNVAGYEGGRSNFQGQENTMFQQRNNNPMYQQNNNSGYGINSMYNDGNRSAYQDNFRNGNNKSSFQQSGQNVMNQQKSTGSQPYGNMKNPANIQNQNSGYQQGNRSTFQPNTRNAPGMSDPLVDFYAEIETAPEETNPNFRQQPFPRPNKSGFDQQSNQVSSTQGFSDMRRRFDQKQPERRNQMGSGKPSIEKGNMAKRVKPFRTEEPDSSTTGSRERSKQSEFEDEDTEYCKLCNAYFTSAPMYALHARGLAHIQRLMAVEAGKDRRPAEKPYIVSGKNYTQTVPPEKINPATVKQNETEKQTEKDSTEPVFNAGCYCEVCNIHVNNERMLWRHYQGKKHLKALKAIQDGEMQMPATQRPPDPNVKKAAVLMETNVPDEEISAINFAFDTVPPDEPIVGLGFLVETMENMNQVIECELCKTKGNLYNMVQHVLGLKHRMQYMKVRDRERYDSINKLNKKLVQSEDARQLCIELEKIEGRGTARYNGPLRRLPRGKARGRLGRAITPPPAHLLRYREQQNVMSESEKRVAIEALKRTLLDDLHKRNIDPDTATKILNSRMELLGEYEKRGVPFVVARERVIEEEERWNLLLEFERQVLNFDEAEQRIDHRFELMKMYEKNGYPREEARRKVLDDEVIYDFKRDFVRLGLQRQQAQKLAEKRLWMLEHLHYQGLSPEAASEKVILIERELKRSVRAMFEEDKRGRGRRDSQTAQWMVAGEELEKYIVHSCHELGLNADQTEDQVGLALEAFDGYRTRRIPAEEAKCRVLVDDLPIPRQPVQESNPVPMEAESANDPGSQVDITNRVLQFKSKLNAALQATTDKTNEEEKETDKQETAAVDQEKQLADYDQQSRVEIQNLLSDMLKMKVPADEARKRLVALYKQHENLRENLFPAKKPSNSTSKTNKTGTPGESKKPGEVSTLTEDKSSKDQSLQEKSSEEPATKTSPGENQETSTDTEAKGEEKTTGEAMQIQTSTEKNTSQGPEDTVGKPSEEKLTTATDRWNASVEMFLQQYGLSKDEYLSQINKRRSSGHERYSPSDLSPRRSRSRSLGRSRCSPAPGKETSPSHPRSLYDRESNRREKRMTSPSRSGSSRWRKMLKSRLRSRSPADFYSRSSSPGHKSRQRSFEREWDTRGGRRSPGRRSPRRSPGRRSPRFSSFHRSQRPRFSPGRRSPRPRFSPDRRSPRRRSPFGRRSPFSRRSPGRRSPHSRGQSPERFMSSPGRSWGRPADFERFPSRSRRPGRSRSRERFDSFEEFGSLEMNRMQEPLTNRQRSRRRRDSVERQKSPVKEPEFNFADGVWPDVDDPWD